MKKYLVTGESIDKLYQEEKVRMERGEIIFTLLPDDFEIESAVRPPHADSKYVVFEDTKDVADTDSKEAEPVKKTSKRTKKSE